MELIVNDYGWWANKFNLVGGESMDISKVNTIQEFNILLQNKALKKGDETTIDDYKWLNEQVRELENKNIAYTVFTEIYEDGMYYIVKGMKWANRMGYIVIKENVEIPVEGFEYK